MAFLETCLLGSANYLKTTAAFKDEPQVDNRLIQNQDEHQDENFCDIGCCVQIYVKFARNGLVQVTCRACWM